MTSELRAPARDLAGAVVLPSLGLRVGVRVRGLPEAMVPLIAVRWDFSGVIDAADAEIDIDVVDEPVGLPPNPLVEAEVAWSSPVEGTLSTNSACASLTWRRSLSARGRLHAPHARGALESLFRAISVLALARRSVTVLHASCVHRDGRGVVFLGASSAGKTTTARRLGREGFSRLSDDMIAIDLSTPRPLLHPLPFERAGRWPARAKDLAEPPVCLGAALVRKGADAAHIAATGDRLSAWSDARIALGAPPGDEERTLDAFEKLTEIPVVDFHVPPRGLLGPVIAGWLSGNESEGTGRRR